MIFTAYFDEAATHGRNPRVTMGGLLGNAYEWQLTQKRLSRLQESYGFVVFHATDFKAHKREFRGWPREKFLALVSDLTDLIRRSLTEGVVITLPREQYLAEYRAPPIPDGMPLDSQYGLCFRACLSQIINVLLSRGGKHHTLNVVIEDGHANVGDTVRIFGEIKKSAAERDVALQMGTISVAAKTDKNAEPLMIADFLSHTHYLFDDASTKGRAPSYQEMTEGIPNQKYDAGLTFLRFEPGQMAAIKQQFADQRQQRIDAWRAARARC